MKKMILIISIVLLSLQACNTDDRICFGSPSPPYGTPDDVEKYETKNYESITYIYYCYNGKYISVTWSKYGDECWEKSEYTSSGICNP